VCIYIYIYITNHTISYICEHILQKYLRRVYYVFVLVCISRKKNNTELQET